jgi:glycosyltransferase involved in cell wall biosynthesis
MPPISVVIPTHNRADELGRAIASVRRQTFPDVEIVVVDDGSTDPGAISFLDTLPADVVLIRQAQAGPAAARNMGVRHAAGQFIFFLDSDDELASECLAALFEALHRRPAAGFAYSLVRLAGSASGIIGSEPNFFECLFANRRPYAMLISRSVFEAIGGYDEAMRLGNEDWEFNIRLGLAGYHGVRVDEPLLIYQIAESGLHQSVGVDNLSAARRYIERKHRDVFTLRALVDLWLRWRRVPSRRPLVAYLFLWAVSRLLTPEIYRACALMLARVRERRQAG